ncbi:MAG: 1,4-alpha-glucan branching protein GlgB [Actinobacteria bacterium]|nr:1,4-alpha-glucan branching protein GlgB [Actinomycetota bacterium]
MSARFGPRDREAFAAGTHDLLHDHLGAHPHPDGGYRFAVWAPRAAAVRVEGDFGSAALRRSQDGIWRGRVAAAEHGQTYRFLVTSSLGATTVKADPCAIRRAAPDGPDSVLWDLDFRWRDGRWMRSRKRLQALDRPISVYEAHLGSWRRGPDGGFLGYRETGRRLAEYCTGMGFTHVEVLPVAEHPFYGSWGYQGAGFFAPTARYGTPQDLMAFVDTLHRAGIGVIFDWVPSHFATDRWGLGRFDGYALYEHRDRRRGFHPDWSSWVFDYDRPEVRSFLLSNARYWLEMFHADGLRVDAVASMLYLDFSRGPGQWLPNAHGGRENLGAYAFLRAVNDMVAGRFPGVLTIAEESSAWPGVTGSTYLGGIGFGLKWDMGWMHDTLEFFRRDPAHRGAHHHELTFRMMYAFSERFMLALSHDEVVHMKASLAGKMRGATDAQRMANLRLLYGYMWTMPGKTTLFMGGEFAQWREWDHDGELEWGLLRWAPHRGMQRWVRDLNRVTAAEPALHRRDFDPGGFQWVDPEDRARSVLSYLRWDPDGTRPVLVVANLSGTRRRRYRAGVPAGGRWKTLLNSDDARYDGGGRTQGALAADDRPAHGFPHSLVLDLAPFSVVAVGPVEQRSKPS